MADDIDDLLDEVEKSLSNDSLASKGSSSSNRSASSSRRGVKKSTSESVKTDDLRDLLDDLEDPPPPPSVTPHSGRGSSVQGGNARCSGPHLAGMSVPPGMATAATLRACNNLRCLNCDLAVLVMDGFCWDDATDYLFLRNNYPDLSNLRTRLEPQRSSRAYACQCQHRSIDESLSVSEDGSLKWVCSGHDLNSLD